DQRGRGQTYAPHARLPHGPCSSALGSRSFGCLLGLAWPVCRPLQYCTALETIVCRPFRSHRPVAHQLCSPDNRDASDDRCTVQCAVLLYCCTAALPTQTPFVAGPLAWHSSSSRSRLCLCLCLCVCVCAAAAFGASL
ncbi:hypothetical protein BCV70DRAFT_231282, partial [Testicularia cyperi]